jgi:hypothetical protein
MRPAIDVPAARRPLGALLVVVLAAALLSAAPATVAAQEGGWDVRIEPATAGNTAVRGGQQVRIAGTAPAGVLTEANVIAITASGTRYVQPTDPSVLNRGPAGPGAERRDYVRNDGGQLQGELTLACLFNDPAVNAGSPSCETDTPVRLVVVQLRNATGAGESNAVRVDVTRPVIRGYELVAPDRVRVVFSEPVRLPGTLQDSALDWRVEGSTVTGVQGPTTGDCLGRYQPGEDADAGATGCTRTLTLSSRLDEDARPFTEYEFSTSRLRDAYVDYASNVLRQATGGAFSRAADLIRPRLPRIEAIDGKSPTGENPTVRSNTRQPTIRVSNARAGHTGFFRITRPNGDVVDTSSAPFTFSGQVHDAPLPALGGSSADDGAYRVEVVVVDPHGNRSDEAGKSGPGGDSGPSVVTYDLLTVRPRLEQAFQTGAREVRVVLSRPVAPAGDAGTWTVDGEPVTASGDGAVRTLRTGRDLSPTSTVSWEPSTSTYRDAHGNELVPFSAPVLTLPPLVPPTVQVPVSEVYQRAAEVTIRGQAAPGLEVELYDAGAEQPRATTAATEEGWSFTVSLPDDARYRFEVRTRRPTTDLRSPPTRVPDVVRDTRAPQVAVHEPSLEPPLGLPVPVPGTGTRREFAVGDPVTVEWTASDPARGDDQVPDHGDRVDVTLRVGAETRLVGPDRPYEPGQRSTFTYTLTEEDRQAQADGAPVFDVTVTDLAENVGRASSAPFTIIRDLIGYTPVTIATARTGRGGLIEARFPEVIQGSSTPFDWQVRDGDRDLQVLWVQHSQQDGRTVVTLEVAGLDDPNATPVVTYVERFARLRGSDGLTRVATTPRLSVDGIAPRLDIARPPAGPLNAASVRLTGETDATRAPNEIRVSRTDEAGQPVGAPVAVTQAGTDGAFALDVPLLRDAHNRLLVEAIDPSGNVGPERTFAVVEDSTDPLVTITNPPGPGRIPTTVTLEWTTVDAHPALVDVAVRIDGGDWRMIASRAVDEGRFRWDVDDDIEPDDVLEFRVLATDAAGNDGEGRRPGLTIGELPGGGPGDGDGPPVGGPGAEGVTAVATGERTIEVRFPGPVETARGAAGFTIHGGPGVEEVRGLGTSRTLILNGDLHTTTPLVIYSGRGVSTLGGDPLEAFRVRAARGFAFAPQDLGGDSRDGTARLSWVDERNTAGEVVRYEIRRDGTLLGSVPGAARSYSDSSAGQGERTYTVTAVDDLDHVSRPATVRLDPTAPNITPDGGFVLSDDGRLALVVPPRAVRKDYHGRFEPVSTGGTAGYGAISGGYRLVAEAAEDRSERLGAFERYATLSFRVGAEALSSREPARVMALRLLQGSAVDELSTRVGRSSADASILTLGDVALGEAVGVTTRVAGPDPALPRNRFTTAAGLSQTSFRSAGAAVIARADDYPDALAASTLAAQVGGPVLLSTTESMPPSTVLELQRLGVERVVLVGGTGALSAGVARQAAELGFAVDRVAGANRFETAARIAERVGAFGGHVYLATGQEFADALAGAGPSSFLTRPILLAARDALPGATTAAMEELDVEAVTILGGTGAVSAGVEQAVRSQGATVGRAAGRTRFETAVALADAVAPLGLTPTRPIAVSGQGDGRTSPDALAAGPVAARRSSPLVLVPRDALGATVDAYLRRLPTVRGVLVAGGTAAVSDRTRVEVDGTR